MLIYNFHKYKKIKYYSLKCIHFIEYRLYHMMYHYITQYGGLHIHVVMLVKILVTEMHTFY